ncbi:hypothetical protein M9H77_16424 [Catharanthus roseus]|uniref:Uncharacterized protein n=1 Tax=Catharanthus roseus TaxID=4058 RepID=A0ACC0B1R0_CATRO|nr:hypothetical protein M9H77_16424 [Catharanthus roseus]
MKKKDNKSENEENEATGTKEGDLLPTVGQPTARAYAQSIAKAIVLLIFQLSLNSDQFSTAETVRSGHAYLERRTHEDSLPSAKGSWKLEEWLTSIAAFILTSHQIFPDLGAKDPLKLGLVSENWVD